MTEAAKPFSPSTIVLLRDGAGGLETFMVVRHHQIDFASGALVFLGGRMEPADAELAAQLDSGAEPLAPLKVAAVREAFEECADGAAPAKDSRGLRPRLASAPGILLYLIT